MTKVIATDGVAWSVCLSVCLFPLVITIVTSATSGSAIAEGPRDALVSIEKLAIDERP